MTKYCHLLWSLLVFFTASFSACFQSNFDIGWLIFMMANIIEICRDIGTGVAGVALATPRFLNLIYKYFWKSTFSKSLLLWATPRWNPFRSPCSYYQITKKTFSFLIWNFKKKRTEKILRDTGPSKAHRWCFSAHDWSHWISRKFCINN